MFGKFVLCLFLFEPPRRIPECCPKFPCAAPFLAKHCYLSSAFAFVWQTWAGQGDEWMAKQATPLRNLQATLDQACGQSTCPYLAFLKQKTCLSTLPSWVGFLKGQKCIGSISLWMLIKVGREWVWREAGKWAERSGRFVFRQHQQELQTAGAERFFVVTLYLVEQSYWSNRCLQSAIATNRSSQAENTLV